MIFYKKIFLNGSREIQLKYSLCLVWDQFRVVVMSQGRSVLWSFQYYTSLITWSLASTAMVQLFSSTAETNGNPENHPGTILMSHTTNTTVFRIAGSISESFIQSQRKILRYCRYDLTVPMKGNKSGGYSRRATSSKLIHKFPYPFSKIFPRWMWIFLR